MAAALTSEDLADVRDRVYAEIVIGEVRPSKPLAVLYCRMLVSNAAEQAALLAEAEAAGWLPAHVMEGIARGDGDGGADGRAEVPARPEDHRGDRADEGDGEPYIF